LETTAASIFKEEKYGISREEIKV